MPIIIRNALPIAPSNCLYNIKLLTSSEKALLTMIRITSLSQTPAMKLNPPSRPLFKLCFMIVNMTGPTDITSINPSVSPATIASHMAANVPCYSKKRNHSSYIFPFITRGNLCWPPIFPFRFINSINLDSGSISRYTSFNALLRSTA